MLTIGCHLSDRDGYLGMAKAAVSIDANTFQFFTRNPRGGAQKALDPHDIAAFEDYAPEHGIEVILGYAPYTANPASDKQAEHDFTMMVLAEDLARMAETPQAMYTLQPGSALGKPVDEALARVAAALNDVITPSQGTPVLVQTMAGEGTQVGSTFEQVASILDQVELDDHVGVLFDACRVWGAGYDIVATWTAWWMSSTGSSASTSCAPSTSTTRRTLSARTRTAMRLSARGGSASTPWQGS